MRTVVGTTPKGLARRGVALDRLSVLTLRRDAFAVVPGSTLTLHLGERTQYRAAASVLDTFERADGVLGDGYVAWTPAGFGALALVGGTVTADVGVTTDRFATYSAGVLARDQWAEATIDALAATGGNTARVGVGVRQDPVAGTGYVATAERVVAGTGATRLTRYNAGTPTVLATEVTPWAAGEVLRLEAAWNRLRVYRQGVCILDHVDSSPLLVTGSPALQVVRLHTNDQAALVAFAAGPLRQEYTGNLAEVGDVTMSLGLVEPTASSAAWAMTVINPAPIGGAARFSDLLRHGINDGANTYDLHRAPVRVVHAIRGGSVPWTVADGRVDHPEAVTDAIVRLVCTGRDAFLTPGVLAGEVTYLPGPLPTLTPAPIPADPCGADAVPVVDAGDQPTEPPESPTAEADAAVAPGPEGTAPGEPSAGSQTPPPLNGLWMVLMGYRLGTGDAGVVYVPYGIGNAPGGTTVIQAKDASVATPEGAFGLGFGPRYSGTSPNRLWHFLQILDYREIAMVGNEFPGAPSGTTEFPFYRERILIYRGPDVVGDALRPNTLPAPPAPGANLVTGTQYLEPEGSTNGPPFDPIGLDIKLKRYQVTNIHSESDLLALRPMSPSDTEDPFPAEIETIQSWLGVTTGVRIADDEISLNEFAGPQLFGLEITPAAALFQQASTITRNPPTFDRFAYSDLS